MLLDFNQVSMVHLHDSCAVRLATSRAHDYYYLKCNAELYNARRTRRRAQEIITMARFLPGPTIGQISGSIGGSTYSHNRSGMYIRDRVKPVVVNSFYTSIQRTTFQMVTSAWRSLTAAQRLSWEMWAHNNPVTDVLGQSQILTGHQAHQKINITAWRTTATLLTVPSIVAAPAPLTALSLTADIGAGDVALAFTPTPIGATNYLQIWAAVTNSPAVNYVKNLYKLIGYADANYSSPVEFEAMVETRLGALVVGQRLTVSVAVANGVTGLTSAPRIISALVKTT